MHTNVALGIASAAAFVITHLYVADQSQNHLRYIEHLEHRIKIMYQYANIESAESLDTQIKCLADNIYYESRSEDYDGQLAVATVTLNRVNNSRFPDTVCQVVWQRNERGCQFSWTCDGVADVVQNKKAYHRAWTVAEDALVEGIRSRGLGDSVVFYHADYVEPFWASSEKLKQVEQIGRHVFYAITN